MSYVTADEIPADVWAREKEIEMGREDLKNKPDAIRAKIAEGRVAKLAQEMALLPQPYLMDQSKTVEQVRTLVCVCVCVCVCSCVGGVCLWCLIGDAHQTQGKASNAA